jgi:hypothetical protein
MAEERSILRRDFGIFLDPGFLVVLVLILLLSAAGAGVLLYYATKYGIPPF